MKEKKNILFYLMYFIFYFIITFIVSIAVTYAYSLLFHGKGIVDFESSFRMGVILGVILTIYDFKNKKNE